MIDEKFVTKPFASISDYYVNWEQGLLAIDPNDTTSASNPVFYIVSAPGNITGVLNTGGAVRYGEEANTASSNW